MTNKRHWGDFPVIMIDLVQKFEEAPSGRLVLNGLSKSDAYSMRNEFHRFRRAIIDAVHRGEDNLTLNELYASTRDMGLSIRPIGTSNLYQLAYTKHIAIRYFDKWELPEPLVVIEDEEV